MLSRFVIHVDLGANFFDFDLLTSILEEVSAKLFTPESLVKLAAEGNLDAVRSIIKKYPDQVKKTSVKFAHRAFWGRVNDPRPKVELRVNSI